MERINLATDMFFSLGTLRPSIKTRRFGQIGAMLLEVEGNIGDDIIYVYGIHYKGKTRKIVFQIDLAEVVCNSSDVYTVQNSIVSKRYQGFGMMAKVYSMIVRKLKIKLRAGSMQSVGGRGIWVRLNELKGVKIIGYGGLRGRIAYNMIDGGEGELVTECGQSPYEKNSFTVVAQAAQ
jgi:hypothetical protein